MLRCLLVEPGPYLGAFSREMPGAMALVLCQFERVNRSLIARVMPDRVVAPLFSARFDIVDLAAILSDAGFGGGLIVVAPPLPDLRLVRRELASVTRGMDLVFAEYRDGAIHWREGEALHAPAAGGQADPAPGSAADDPGLHLDRPCVSRPKTPEGG